jgi:ribosomal protein S18 acetylase RimI-like enzyme
MSTTRRWIFGSGVCEMKRLYVRPAGRGSGAGRALVRAAIAFAGAVGYREILLDSLPGMSAAIAIYRDLGFEEIPPYWNNTLPGILFFGKQLRR